MKHYFLRVNNSFNMAHMW